MYKGYLSLGGVEVLNATRTASYVRRHLPGVTLGGCHTCPYLRYALVAGATDRMAFPGNAYPGSSYPNGALTDPDLSYIDPQTDNAPWYRAQRAATRQFYGFFPLDVQGLDDSTHTTSVTSLVSDGGVLAQGHHGPREIRVRAVGIASTEAGLSEGLAWLRAVLDSTAECHDATPECGGRQMRFFSYCPGGDNISLVPNRAADATRIMYQVEAQEGPLVTPQRSKVGHMAIVEFTLVAAIPWAFTTMKSVGLITGIPTRTVEHIAYPPALDTYHTLIDDPVYGSIVRPPRPPLLIPDAVQTPENWHRYTIEVLPEHMARHGRGMIRVRVRSGTTERRMIRIRLYSNQSGQSMHDVGGGYWEGEFLVSWIPKNAELVLDSALETATLAMLDTGFTSPGGHLVHGSDGRPFQWPSLACDVPYVVHVDSAHHLGDARIHFELATRE